jgi:type III restriction enzyme
MKLKFDAHQKYQLDAVDAIVNIFEGLPQNQNEFSFDLKGKNELISELGVGNSITLSEEQTLQNIRTIQAKNSLLESPQLLSEEYPFPNFTIEMETGTGKTYVYLRTIFELNKKYGYKKFIIVVPSIAIREGVIKNLDITKKHFQEIYDNVSSEHFVYNSKRPGLIRKYATSNTIQIMIMNIQAFQRDVQSVENEKNAALFHREADRLSGRAPKEYIASVKPIVILDEPQSIDNTVNGKRAVQSLNPLFVLRYSATHREVYNLMYRLDPVQAFEQGLVKQIVVASVLDEPNFNGAYVKLLELDNTNGIRAKIEYHEDTGTAQYSVKQKWVKNGSDLFMVSGEREEYRNGFIISEITLTED